MELNAGVVGAGEAAAAEAAGGDAEIAGRISRTEGAAGDFGGAEEGVLAFICVRWRSPRRCRVSRRGRHSPSGFRARRGEGAAGLHRPLGAEPARELRPRAGEAAGGRPQGREFPGRRRPLAVTPRPPAAPDGPA